jgi:hypothetical protein
MTGETTMYERIRMAVAVACGLQLLACHSTDLGTASQPIVTTLCGYGANTQPTGPSIGDCMHVCSSTGADGTCDAPDDPSVVTLVYGCAGKTDGASCDGYTNGGVEIGRYYDGRPVTMSELAAAYPEYCTFQIDVGDADPWQIHDFVIWQRDECVQVCTTPPAPTVSASPVLEPPNHEYHDIDIARDCQITWDAPCGGVDPQATRITCVSSDEPDNGLGDGDTANDIVLVDGQHLRLRAERSGRGDGRCYVISFEAVDGAGNTGTGTCTVSVQHDASHPAVCGAVDHSVCSAGLIWPNEASKANSDPWLLANHQAIVQMRPNVLLLNFVNGFSTASATTKFQQVAAAYREATRHHAATNPAATPFVDFQLAKVVDLTDNPPPAGWPFQNSTKFPRPSTSPPFGNLDYSRFFGSTFASYYGYPDGAGGYLDLCELIDQGAINELWFLGSGDVPDAAAAESLESKQRYDSANRKIPGSFDRCAGNGCFATSAPVCGRSVRIAFINYNRGVGCFLESLGHSFEGMSNNGSLPYLRPYFQELGMFNLGSRYGAPFQSFYSCPYGVPCLSYGNVTPASVRLDWDMGWGAGTIDPFLPACGNAHFPPNGRRQYDVTNPQAVPSTCAHFRMKDGPGGADAITMYSSADSAPYDALSPDCTKGWEVYWRQNFPGLNNQAKDAAGNQMLNWWPFLYY